MRMDLSKKRKDYFALPTVHEIVSGHIKKDLITINDLRTIKDKIVVAAPEGDLEALLDSSYTRDTTDLVAKVDSLAPDQLLVLPPDYRIKKGDSTRLIAYDKDNFINLNSIKVNRSLIEEDARSGPLSRKVLNRYKLTPEDIISTAFKLILNQRDPDENITGYCWWGPSDRQRRIVTLYRALQGAELRAFSFFAECKLKIPQIKNELSSSKTYDKKDLTQDQKTRRNSQLTLAQDYVSKHGLTGILQKLRVSFSDIIEQASPEMHDGSMNYSPRQDIKRIVKTDDPRVKHIRLSGIPFSADLKNSYDLVWKIRGRCNCPDKHYRSDKRDTVNDEHFFCPHEIAAFHTLKHTYKKSDQPIRHLPFVIPTQKMISYADKLRYQAIILDHGARGISTKRTLNNTEIDQLMWKRVMIRGYNDCFTTDASLIRGYDPLQHLITFTGS